MKEYITKLLERELRKANPKIYNIIQGCGYLGLLTWSEEAALYAYERNNYDSYSRYMTAPEQEAAFRSRTVDRILFLLEFIESGDWL